MNPRLRNAILVARDRCTQPLTVSDEQAIDFATSILKAVPDAPRADKPLNFNMNDNAGAPIIAFVFGPAARAAILSSFIDALLKPAPADLVAEPEILRD